MRDLCGLLGLVLLAAGSGGTGCGGGKGPYLRDPALLAQWTREMEAATRDLNAQRADAATEGFERALGTARSIDPRGSQTYTTLLKLGQVRLMTGDSGRAEEPLKEALQLVSEAPSPDEETLASVLVALGEVEGNRGRWDEALDHLEQALRIRRRTRGDKRETVAFVLRKIGRVLQLKGDWDAAGRSITEAYAMLADAPGGSSHLTFLLVEIGRCALGAGRAEKAYDVLSDVTGWFARSESLWHSTNAVESYILLARAADAVGKKAEADAARDRAWKAFEAPGSVGVNVTPDMFITLGDFLRARGAEPRALTQYELARRLALQQGGEGHPLAKTARERLAARR